MILKKSERRCYHSFLTIFSINMWMGECKVVYKLYPIRKKLLITIVLVKYNIFNHWIRS